MRVRELIQDLLLADPDAEVLVPSEGDFDAIQSFDFHSNEEFPAAIILWSRGDLEV